MIWPANVIAQIALAEWPNKAKARDAVAICLTASEGDDSFLYSPSVRTLPELKGAWAIPWLPEMDQLELDPFRLRSNAKLARIMTGPNGDEWEWSAVYNSGFWKRRIAEANTAINNPQAGIISESPIPNNNVAGTVRALRNSASSALTAMQDMPKALRQPFKL